MVSIRTFFIFKWGKKANGCSFTVLSDLNKIDFSTWFSGFKGQLKNLQIYKTALTDQECINLTTL
jgi:hypothetical protein